MRHVTKTLSPSSEKPMSSSVTGGEKLHQFLSDLQQKSQNSPHVNVGVVHDATYEDGTPVTTVAAAQELGTATIPARPFMRPTVAENSHNWSHAVAQRLAHNGKDPTEALEHLGSQISNEMQDTLAALADPPLAASTVQARARAGSGNPAQPLHNTGRLINSITYQVEDD